MEKLLYRIKFPLNFRFGCSCCCQNRKKLSTLQRPFAASKIHKIISSLKTIKMKQERKKMVCIKMMRLQSGSHFAHNGVSSSADGHLSNDCLFSAYSQFLFFFQVIFCLHSVSVSHFHTLFPQKQSMA